MILWQRAVTEAGIRGTVGARRGKGEINMRSAECFINYVTFKLDFGGKGISSDEEGERITVGRKYTVWKIAALLHAAAREQQEEELRRGVSR